MTEEIFDIAIKIDIDVTAVQFIEIILELKEYIYWFNTDNVEWDEHYIYIEAQYRKSDETDLFKYLSEKEHVQIDHSTMADWL